MKPAPIPRLATAIALISNATSIATAGCPGVHRLAISEVDGVFRAVLELTKGQTL